MRRHSFHNNRMQKTVRSKQKGFTLIELLVVIAIIGMLSSIVLSSLNTARQKGRDTRRVADLAQLQTALELYYASQATPAYPAALSSLAPTYIASVPNDPQTGSAYNYQGYTVSSRVVSYCVGAVMESTVPNPADTCNVPTGATPTTEPTGSYRVGPQ